MAWLSGADDAHPAGHLDHGAEDRLDLQRAARLHILQHGRLVVAHFGRAIDALFNVDGELDAKRLGDRLAFQHHRARHGPAAGVGGDHVQRGRGQRADRVERHVAPQLDPQLVADARPHRRFQAGGDHQGGQRVGAGRARAVRLAQAEAVAIAVVDHAGRVDGGGRIDDGAQALRGRQRLAQRAGGIDAKGSCGRRTVRAGRSCTTRARR